jgi:hypothetical protein
MIREHVDFVKAQVEYHRRRLEQYTKNGNASLIGVHQRLHAGFNSLLDAMNSDINTPDSPAASEQNPSLDSLLANPIALDRAQLTGLPQELLAQLQISPAEKFQWQVVDIIERTPNKTISLEVLLIALYKTTGEVFERTDLSNRIYRMMKKGIVFGVTGKKGQYTTLPQAGDQLTLETNGNDEELDESALPTAVNQK